MNIMLNFVEIRNSFVIEVPEEKQPETKTEQLQANLGMTQTDVEPTNIASGAIGLVFIVITTAGILSLDLISIKRDFGRLKKNLRRIWKKSKHSIKQKTYLFNKKSSAVSDNMYSVTAVFTESDA